MLSSYLFKKGVGYVHSLFTKKKPKKDLLTEGDVDLHAVIKSSYGKEADQEKFAKDYNYIFDKELSNDNQQVYFNPENKHLMFSVTGTHNLADVGTDFKLMTGGLKQTKRFKEAEDTFAKAKSKYEPSSTTAVGHSMGGSITAKLNADKIVTYNKGMELGGKTRKRETAVRSTGDIISALGMGNKHMTTISGGNLTDPSTWLRSHNSDVLKNRGLMVPI